MKRLCRYLILLGAGLLLLPTLALADSNPMANYHSRCAMCHGADGKAETPAGKEMKIPSFSSPEIIKMSDNQILDIITNGRGQMPAYTDRLSFMEILSLKNYVRVMQKK